MAHKVGDVARLAGVSVRTLHHYDELGLLSPSQRSDSGYRLYSEQDLTRLQQILFYRELGFELGEIRSIMEDPEFEHVDALRHQRDLIAEQVLRLEALLGLIEKTIAADEGGTTLTKEEMFEVFGDFDPADYQDEVMERWGDTDAYRESTRRVRRYTKEDWQRHKDEADENLAAMVALFDAGVAPGDARAMDVAEAARLQIDRWFYPCSREMHMALGDMYIADARFTDHYDRHRPGLAAWFRDAIAANLARG